RRQRQMCIRDRDIIALENTSNISILEQLSNINWLFVIGQIIVVAAVYALGRKIADSKNVNGIPAHYLGEFHKMLAENNEERKKKLPEELSPVFASLAKNDGDLNSKIASVAKEQQQLAADFNSFAFYNQALLAIASADYSGAYFCLVHSIKGSLESRNLQNIPRVFKSIKEQVLPFLCKSDIEKVRKEKNLDIEEAFKHVAQIDQDKVFALSIQELRQEIFQLPDSRYAANANDLHLDTTFIEVQTSRGRTKVRLGEVRQLFTQDVSKDTRN
ncbi:MAG: hypothetical protein IAE95_03075, partial [Chitinophagaceae bacterium]|nr:hypothetical protein [Chitinophagaceae bacterium]